MIRLLFRGAIILSCLLLNTNSQTCTKALQNQPGNPIHWSEVPTTYFADNPHPELAILPLGSIEQHGPHLPLGTDTFIAVGIIEYTLARYRDSHNVIVLPPCFYGASFEHDSFEGTIAIEDEVVDDLWLGIIRGIFKKGIVRKVVMITGHGGQGINVGKVVRDFRFKGGVGEVFGVDLQGMLGRVYGEIVGEEGVWERKFGIHGGLIETSVMLFLRRELVDMGKAKRFEARKGGVENLVRFGKEVDFGWKIEDWNEEGAVGDAKAATAELGGRLVEMVSQELGKIFDELIDQSTVSFRFDAADQLCL